MCPSGRQSDQELPPHRYLETLTRRISGFSFRERINFLRDQRIPRFLYKFRAAPDTSDSIRSITDIILNSNLWLSSPADFMTHSTWREKWSWTQPERKGDGGLMSYSSKED
jgi:hypothetical protein